MSRFTFSSPRLFVTGLLAALFPVAAAAAEADDLRVIAPGEAGFYEVRDSRLRLAAGSAEGRDGRDFRLAVRPAGSAADERVVAANPLAAGESFEFDLFLGYLAAGDTVAVSTKSIQGAAPGAAVAELAYTLERVPAIPVTVFAEDAPKPALGWALTAGVAADSPAERRLARGDPARDGAGVFAFSGGAARVRLGGGAPREALASFLAPHSGYHALHEAWAERAVAGSGEVRVRVYAGDAMRPVLERVVGGAAGRAALDADIGYLAKGEAIHVAFSLVGADGEAEIAFDATLAEWAPRRAPLRVKRGDDGLLDVYEPEAPRRAIDIPERSWITVRAGEGDATAVIREALLEAQANAAKAGAGSYAGVRLESGKTYPVAREQIGGRLFEVKGAERVVFDGNGATLRLDSPELQRKGINLFSTSASRNIVFADFIVESGAPPFATGEIVSVGPVRDGGQTVTFRLDPGSPDPVADIARAGSPSAYVYDLKNPGRMAEGVWSHYPGGSPVAPEGRPGHFTHTVRRTSGSLPAEGKWLVKNKGGGVVYLTTDGKSENITLSGLDGRAPGGGLSRFWMTSGVNLLNCRLVPRDGQWISSTADGVHGRGREGVWIEDTIQRGVCEDVMNTYGLNLVVLDEDAAADNSEVSLRVFYPGRYAPDGEFALSKVEPNMVRAGDPLVFFNPVTGGVIGRATVRSITDGRAVLSNPVPGIDRWKKGSNKKSTMVYSPRQAARFFVRDSRLMDGMRFGIFIKAEGGVMFNNHFEGLSSNPVMATNEPEWPEGVMPTNLWVQGNTFSRNNDSYIVKHRDFLSVDPAEISVYTRRMTDPTAPDDHRAHLVRGEYSNSHVKIVGNVFHDWRGMAVAVRNARNVRIDDNLLLPPVDDARLRATLAKDPLFAPKDGGAARGAYAGIFLETVGGARLHNNRFVGLAGDDRSLVRGDDVSGLVVGGDVAESAGLAGAEAWLNFSEWFGDASDDAAGGRTARLRAVDRVIGRLGAGVGFDRQGAVAVLPPASGGSVGAPARGLSFALWVRPEPVATAAGSTAPRILCVQGDVAEGAVLLIDARGRLSAGVWSGERGAWLDLGEAEAGLWRHVALVHDGAAGTLAGFVDGLELAVTRENVPAGFATEPRAWTTAFGDAVAPARTGPGASARVAAGGAPFRGTLDEFHRFERALSPSEITQLALRHP